MILKLLDLFCGAGGCSVGYQRAGFEVYGVDKDDKKDYPFLFYRTEWDRVAFDDFDVIHASPPCQINSITANLARAQGRNVSVVDLVGPVREALLASGKPYIIENVVGAPLINPTKLCGSMFGLRVRRHRLFESNVPLTPPGPCRHKEQGRPVGVHSWGKWGHEIPQGGRSAASLEDAQDAMGIDWMSRRDIAQAIPPAYTEHLGAQLMALVAA